MPQNECNIAIFDYVCRSLILRFSRSVYHYLWEMLQEFFHSTNVILMMVELAEWLPAPSYALQWLSKQEPLHHHNQTMLVIV